MGRAYSDITFTPTVRDVQSEMGSREQYAFLDTMSDRGDVLTARESQFIAEADHFFQATVSETGWPYVQHRGGPKGFLKVLDARTIGFASSRITLSTMTLHEVVSRKAWCQSTLRGLSRKAPIEPRSRLVWNSTHSPSSISNPLPFSRAETQSPAMPCRSSRLQPPCAAAGEAKVAPASASAAKTIRFMSCNSLSKPSACVSRAGFR